MNGYHFRSAADLCGNGQVELLRVGKCLNEKNYLNHWRSTYRQRRLLGLGQLYTYFIACSASPCDADALYKLYFLCRRCVTQLCWMPVNSTIGRIKSQTRTSVFLMFDNWSETADWYFSYVADVVVHVLILACLFSKFWQGLSATYQADPAEFSYFQHSLWSCISRD